MAYHGRAMTRGNVKLIRMVGRGDQDEFTELYHRHYRRVYAFLACKCGQTPEVDVLEITQETFARFWECRQRFRGRSQVQTFLFGIANNVYREYCRKWAQSRGVRSEHDSKRTAARPLQILVHKELEEQVQKAICSLTPRQREAVQLVGI